MTATTWKIRIHFAAYAIAAAVMAAAPSAYADAGHEHTAAIGEPGARAKADRTITISIRDNLYQPKSITVKKGETIRFVIKNTDALLHEFNIGTTAMHSKHQKEMAVMAERGLITATGINRQLMNMDHSKSGMPVMKHDDPNSVMVEPGKTAELVWTFSKNAKLQFACNLPGHYEAGMVGQIHFRR